MTVTIDAGIGTTRLRPRLPIVDSLLTFCRAEFNLTGENNIDADGYTVEVSFDETDYFVRRFKPDTFEIVTTTDPITGRTVRTNGSNEEQEATVEEAELAVIINSLWQVLTITNTGGTTVGTDADFELITENDITYNVWEIVESSPYDNSMSPATLITSGSASPVAGVVTVSVTLTTLNTYYVIEMIDLRQTGWQAQQAT